MADTNVEIVAILRHYFKLGLKATEAARRIRKVEGNISISDRTAQNWFRRFKNGDLSIEVKPRSGRPSVVDYDALRRKLEENPNTSTRKLSKELGSSKDTICRALHKLQRPYREDQSLSYEEEEDDLPHLSVATMVALQEFYAEQLQQLSSKDNESQKLKENWQLSQFWYDDKTSEGLAKEAFAACGENGRICCLSSPTAFRKMLKLKPEGCTLKLLEFDKRFELFGEDFLFYDYNDPLSLPAQWEHYFDVVLAEPPFLSEECLTKTSQSIKYLTKNKIILCVGAIMEECAQKLLQVTPTNFEVNHENNLRNNLMCYTNYKPHILNSLEATQVATEPKNFEGKLEDSF